MTNDEKDRYVLAVTVRGNVEVLVTFNLKDFRESALKSFDISVVHPDDFLLDQLDLYPRRRPRLPGEPGRPLHRDQRADDDRRAATVRPWRGLAHRISPTRYGAICSASEQGSGAHAQRHAGSGLPEWAVGVVAVFLVALRFWRSGQALAFFIDTSRIRSDRIRRRL